MSTARSTEHQVQYPALVLDTHCSGTQRCLLPAAPSLCLGTPVAVVWCAEHSDHLLLMLPQEALTDKLVSPDDEAQPVCVVPVLTDVLQGSHQLREGIHQDHTQWADLK